jgi:hypothetical protein
VVEGGLDVRGSFVLNERNIPVEVDQLHTSVGFSTDLEDAGKFSATAVHQRILELEKAVNLLQEQLRITPRIRVGQ